MRGSIVTRPCRILLGVLVAAYAIALAVLAIGTFGLFGQPRDPLSAVFLMPLGLPWNRFIDVFPERLWPWLAAAAPAINLAIIALICRLLGRADRG